MSPGTMLTRPLQRLHFRYPGLRQRVKRLITLGTPHYSKEQYPFGRVKEHVSSGDRDFDSSLAFTNAYFGMCCVTNAPTYKEEL